MKTNNREDKQMAKKVNPLDILDAMATDKPVGGKKAAIPVVDVANTIQKKVKELKDLNDEINSKKAKYELLSQEIIDAVEPKRITLCEKGEFTTSVKVADGTGGDVLVSWVAKYSKVPLEQVPVLQNTLGDKMSQYIAIETEVTIADPTDAELITKLIKALGKDEFMKSFKVTKTVKVKDTYAKEFYTLPKDKRSTLSQIVVPQKPSIRTK